MTTKTTTRPWPPSAAAEGEAALLDALREHSLEKIEAAVLDLGPHIDTVVASIEATATPGKLRVSAMAESRAGTHSGVFDVSRGVEAATLVGVPQTVIAIAIEQCLRTADRACDWRTMIAICEWLGNHPEQGLIPDEANGPGHWRPVRTWRLDRVRAEAARQWRAQALDYMRKTGIRHARAGNSR